MKVMTYTIHEIFTVTFDTEESILYKGKTEAENI